MTVAITGLKTVAFHTRKLSMSLVPASKYALAESPPTKRLSAKEQAKAEALAQLLVVAD